MGNYQTFLLTFILNVCRLKLGQANKEISIVVFSLFSPKATYVLTFCFDRMKNQKMQSGENNGKLTLFCPNSFILKKKRFLMWITAVLLAYWSTSFVTFQNG